MAGIGIFFDWVALHTQLLSGLAALVVLGGVFVSPVGQGVRSLLAHRRKRRDRLHTSGPSVGFVSGAVAPPLMKDRPSIAVLPFTNMSDDREQEFLADGMTEDVITGLSRDARLFVIARNSTFSYKGKAPNVRDVGRELGARYVLEGSVRRIGETLRVTAQLIDATAGSHVWADTLDRPLAEIFKMQDEITQGIVASLTSHLKFVRDPTAARSRPESLEAWELYVRALESRARRHNAEGSREAEDLLRQAVKKDPTYAEAWALLGSLICIRNTFRAAGYDAAADEAEALACVERAEALAPDSPETLCARGTYLVTVGRQREALLSMQRAVERNPNDVFARTRLATTLIYCGQPTRALEELERVLRLSPRDPFATVTYHWVSICKFLLQDYAAAETWARRAIAASPGNVWAWANLALSLAALGKVEPSRDAMREAVHLAPEMSYASLERMFRGLVDDDHSFVPKSLELLAITWPAELK